MLISFPVGLAVRSNERQQLGDRDDSDRHAVGASGVRQGLLDPLGLLREDGQDGNFKSAGSNELSESGPGDMVFDVVAEGL